MFYRMDEAAGKKGYGIWRVAVDALAAGMIVTCLLDFWRLGVGRIYETAVPKPQAYGGRFGLPWL